QDPAFTISGLLQYTKHGNAIILVNINCKIPFLISSIEQSCDFYRYPAERWLKLVGGVFILL
ncbi:unnamed protein product, partial [Staurois parvus]